jgi:hypothetical protein
MTTKRRKPKTRNDEKPSKRSHSAAEIANDPSLKYCGYRTFEAIYSDGHVGYRRFVRYTTDGTEVVLAEMAGMREIPGVFSALSIRRT